LIVANAVAKRRAEFRAGRSYAREALAQVGCPRSKILKDRRGAPLWPSGYRGSISHTDGLAIAVAAPHAYFRGLGLDVETVAPVDKDLEPFIFHPEELLEIPRWEGCDVDPSKCMFSAKEAFIKLYYSMENILLDFLDVRISFDKSLNEYSAYTSDPTVMATSLGGKAARGYLGWNRRTVTAIMYVHRSDELQ
jgi:4'-phosphopantetheinyl transferase EntD